MHDKKKGLLDLLDENYNFPKELQCEDSELAAGDIVLDNKGNVLEIELIPKETNKMIHLMDEDGRDVSAWARYLLNGEPCFACKHILLKRKMDASIQ